MDCAGGLRLVDSEENGREELEPGWSTLVDAKDTPTFGTDAGMTLVKVFGGWMMPEGAREDAGA